jgi:hypothetical protein
MPLILNYKEPLFNLSVQKAIYLLFKHPMF